MFVERLSIEAVMDRCLRAAILAPSPDNTQPWRLRRLSHGIEARLDPARTGQFLDGGNAFPDFSLGAVAENIVQAAGGMDWRAEVTASGQQAAIALQPGAPDIAFVSPETMARRRTVRGKLARDIDAGRLDRAASVLPAGLHLLWMTQQSAHVALSRTLAAAERLRFANPVCHREMHNVIRAVPADDGLHRPSLGLGPAEFAMLRVLRPWPVMRVVTKLQGHRLMARQTAQRLRDAAGIGVLLQQRGGSWFEAGRGFQRLWLALTQERIAVQPWAFPVLLASVPERHRARAFSPCELASGRRIVDDLWQSLSPHAAADVRVAMIFRFGQEPDLLPRATARRPLADFLDA